MCHRDKELLARMRCLTVVLALVIVGTIVGVMLYAYDLPGRNMKTEKPISSKTTPPRH